MLYLFWFIIWSPVSRHPLVNDDAVESNTLLTDQNINVFQGSEEGVKTEEYRRDVRTLLRDVSAGPLKWPSSKTYEPLDFQSIN